MVRSKGWNWDAVTDAIWQEPSRELYAAAVRWKRAGVGEVLDLGCGSGRNAILLAEMGFHVEAFDLSDSGIARLREQARRRRLPIGTRIGDMLALPYEDATFGAVLAFHVIYHTDSQGIERAISQLKRVLRPGGEALVTFNSKANPSFREPSSKRIDANTLVKTEGLEAGIPHCYVDEADIRRLLAGLDIVRLEHLGEIGRGWRGCHYLALATKV